MVWLRDSMQWEEREDLHPINCMYRGTGITLDLPLEGSELH